MSAARVLFKSPFKSSDRTLYGGAYLSISSLASLTKEDSTTVHTACVDAAAPVLDRLPGSHKTRAAPYVDMLTHGENILLQLGWSKADANSAMDQVRQARGRNDQKRPRGRPRGPNYKPPAEKRKRDDDLLNEQSDRMDRFIETVSSLIGEKAIEYAVATPRFAAEYKQRADLATEAEVKRLRAPAMKRLEQELANSEAVGLAKLQVELETLRARMEADVRANVQRNYQLVAARQVSKQFQNTH